MKSGKDITGFEYVIYHFNRFGAFILSILAVIYSWQYMLPVVLVGWVCFFIMYYVRDIFYRQGFGRYAIYCALFYIGVFAALWIKPISINFEVKWLFSLQGLNYILANWQNIIDYTAGLWGISFGVVLYILMVELDRSKVKKHDIKALGLTNNDLYNYSTDLIFGCYVLSCIVLAIAWNCILALIILIYLFASLYINRANVKWLDLGILIALLVLSYKGGLVSWPTWVNSLYHQNELLAIIKNEFVDFKTLVPQGVLLGAVPLFMAKFVTNLFTTTKKAEELLNEENPNKENMVVGDMLLGVSCLNGSKVYLTDRENNQHTVVLGTTGAGKTNTTLKYVEHCAKNSYPCVFLDGKGSLDLILAIKKIADSYNREFKVFTLKPHVVPEDLQHHLASYNPFSSGTATEWKNRIMALFSQAEGRGQQHFALMEEKYINTIVNILQRAGGKLNLKQLLVFIKEPELLQHLAVKIGDNLLIQQASELNEDLKDVAKDVTALLELFIYSSYGMLFDPQQLPNIIDLKQSIKSGEIVLFMFDASAYKSDTEKVAKMVINDLNSSFSELASPIKTYAIFDEFASYASSNLSDTISLQRSNGLHAVVGTQSVTTVGLKSLETQRVAEELLACCNTYLLMATNHDEDIERMAKIFGTRRTFEITTQLDVRQGGGTGLGSSRTVDEFLVHPQKVRDLKSGEAFIYRKASGLKPFKIKIYKV